MSLSGENKLITIFGGSGFLGRHIVRELAREGYRIRVAVRRPELAVHLQPLGGVGQVHAVQANLLNEESVRFAVSGADVVINLVGILYQSGKQKFRDIHVTGAEYIAKAAREAGASDLIQMSALGASLKSSSKYARSKAEGEQRVLEEFPAAVILQPSVVFGPEDDFFNRFAELANYSLVLPLIRGGVTKFQPVYVGDVAQAVVHCVGGKAIRGKIYQLGGPEIITLEDVMRKMLQFTQRKRFLLRIPSIVAKYFMAPFLSLLPNPVLTMDQVNLLGYDNVVSGEGELTLEDLGIQKLHAIDSIVPSYLERFRPHGQFSGKRL